MYSQGAQVSHTYPIGTTIVSLPANVDDSVLARRARTQEEEEEGKGGTEGGGQGRESVGEGPDPW